MTPAKGQHPPLSAHHRRRVTAGVRKHWSSERHRRGECRCSNFITKTVEKQNAITEGIRRHLVSEQHRTRKCNHHRHHSKETVEKIAKAVVRNRYSDTWMERALSNLLTLAGFEFEEQVRFGRYVVDAWLSQERLVFEADASFYHQDEDHEIQRDAYLMDRGVLAVVHLNEHDLRSLEK